MSNTGAATCKVCGARHWMRDPHVWAVGEKEKKISEAVSNMPVEIASRVLKKSEKNLTKSNKGLKTSGKNLTESNKLTKSGSIVRQRNLVKFDKKSYQREYMRKRRARDRG